MSTTLTESPVRTDELTFVDEPLTTEQEDDLLLIEAGENKVKEIRDKWSRGRRSFTTPRAWTLGGNVD